MPLKERANVREGICLVHYAVRFRLFTASAGP